MPKCPLTNDELDVRLDILEAEFRQRLEQLETAVVQLTAELKKFKRIAEHADRSAADAYYYHSGR